MQEIFFVCDHQESPDTRKNFLEMTGFQVTLMDSGEECLERLQKSRPALVLMEILLQGQNGFEMCRRIREKHPAQQVPVILCSGIYRARAYRDAALAAGAQRFLVLPVEFEALAEAVTQVLHEVRAPTAAA